MDADLSPDDIGAPKEVTKIYAIKEIVSSDFIL